MSDLPPFTHAASDLAFAAGAARTRGRGSGAAGGAVSSASGAGGRVAGDDRRRSGEAGFDAHLLEPAVPKQVRAAQSSKICRAQPEFIPAGIFNENAPLARFFVTFFLDAMQID
jgi:hypothetical protein